MYLGLVHRLDRPTAGVMVFARTSKAAARLSAQIQSGVFEKTYLAVLTAAPPEQAGTLRHWLVKDKATHIAHIVGAGTPGAKRAELEYEVLAQKDGLYLTTYPTQNGPLHQIRAQMAAVNASVYGDMKYALAYQDAFGTLRLPRLFGSSDDRTAAVPDSAARASPVHTVRYFRRSGISLLRWGEMPDGKRYALGRSV